MALDAGGSYRPDGGWERAVRDFGRAHADAMLVRDHAIWVLWLLAALALTTIGVAVFEMKLLLVGLRPILQNPASLWAYAPAALFGFAVLHVAAHVFGWERIGTAVTALGLLATLTVLTCIGLLLGQSWLSGALDPPGALPAGSVNWRAGGTLDGAELALRRPTPLDAIVGYAVPVLTVASMFLGVCISLFCAHKIQSDLFEALADIRYADRFDSCFQQLTRAARAGRELKTDIDLGEKERAEASVKGLTSAIKAAGDASMEWARRAAKDLHPDDPRHAEIADRLDAITQVFTRDYVEIGVRASGVPLKEKE